MRPCTRSNSAHAASAAVASAASATRDRPAAIASGSCSRLDQLHAEREALLADDLADPVEPPLVVVVRLAALHPRGERLDAARQVERARIDQPVEQLGPPGELVGERPGERQHAQHQREQAGALARTGGTG